jgi:glycosyltransferase involved in cell wall biosynthesis
MEPGPLVSIVTPSFNSGEFLEATIRSVLDQEYPLVEYLVMDGGSMDGSLAILHRYRGQLEYVSEPDHGAADAINRGFRRAQGEILAWIGADDLYLPGAIAAAVEAFAAAPDAAVVYGEASWIDERGERLGRYPTGAPYRPGMFRRECCVCQPACFVRRSAAESVGLLDSSLTSAFDYDFWIRLSQRYEFHAIPRELACSRMHRRNKSLGQKRQMFEESMGLLERHYGYVPVQWVYGHLAFQQDGADQFFAPLRYSAGTWLRSLAEGSRRNRSHLSRYWAEWAGTTLGRIRRQL